MMLGKITQALQRVTAGFGQLLAKIAILVTQNADITEKLGNQHA